MRGTLVVYNLFIPDHSALPKGEAQLGTVPEMSERLKSPT
jgi:hypothetical protein